MCGGREEKEEKGRERKGKGKEGEGGEGKRREERGRYTARDRHQLYGKVNLRESEPKVKI